jgi:hypothetical protein
VDVLVAGSLFQTVSCRVLINLFASRFRGAVFVRDHRSHARFFRVCLCARHIFRCARGYRGSAQRRALQHSLFARRAASPPHRAAITNNSMAKMASNRKKIEETKAKAARAAKMADGQRRRRRYQAGGGIKRKRHHLGSVSDRRGGEMLIMAMA